MSRRRGLLTVGSVIAILVLGAGLALSTDADGASGQSPVHTTVGLALPPLASEDAFRNAMTAASLVEERTSFAVTSVQPDDGAERSHLSNLVDSGANPIVAVGPRYAAALRSVAPIHPEIDFAIVDAVVDQPNVTSLVVSEEAGSFLMGVLAARHSQTGEVGFVGDRAARAASGAWFRSGAQAAAAEMGRDVQVHLGLPGVLPADRGRPDALVDVGVDVLFSVGSGHDVFTVCADREVTCLIQDAERLQAYAHAPRVQASILSYPITRADLAVPSYIDRWAAGEDLGGSRLQGTQGWAAYARANPDLAHVHLSAADAWALIEAGDVVVPTTP